MRCGAWGGVESAQHSRPTACLGHGPGEKALNQGKWQRKTEKSPTGWAGVSEGDSAWGMPSAAGPSMLGILGVCSSADNELRFAGYTVVL